MVVLAIVILHIFGESSGFAEIRDTSQISVRLVRKLHLVVMEWSKFPAARRKSVYFAGIFFATISRKFRLKQFLFLLATIKYNIKKRKHMFDIYLREKNSKKRLDREPER